MTKIAKQLTELVGNTPLLELNKYSQAKGLDTPVIAKVEYFNPGGSVKDRIALAMIEDAEQKGILKPGATIIEPTSGNTGVGLALVSAVKGYKLILTMPETMSVERRNLVKAYGADGQIDIFVAVWEQAHHLRGRSILEGAEGRREGYRRGAEVEPCAERWSERSAQDSGHWCRLRAQDVRCGGD